MSKKRVVMTFLIGILTLIPIQAFSQQVVDFDLNSDGVTEAIVLNHKQDSENPALFEEFVLVVEQNEQKYSLNLEGLYELGKTRLDVLVISETVFPFVRIVTGVGSNSERMDLYRFDGTKIYHEYSGYTCAGQFTIKDADGDGIKDIVTSTRDWTHWLDGGHMHIFTDTFVNGTWQLASVYSTAKNQDVTAEFRDQAPSSFYK